MQEFVSTARRLRVEREAAATNVERLLRRTPRAEWPALASHPDLLTCGALERLGTIFNDAEGRDPRYALNLTELGVLVAESLPGRSYPEVIMAQILAHAWKDLGRAYRGLARNTESLEALERADRYLDNHVALAHDRALVRFNLAITLQEMERYTEARELLTESREVFRAHGDVKRLARCGLFEGVLLQRLKQFREAREIYFVVVSSTPNLDQESLAALHQAIGFCSIELADYTTAEANLDRALTINQQLGRSVEIMKVELGRGRLLTRTGNHQKAIDHLRPVRRQFLASGMAEEAGLCGLEAVDAMLALGKASQAENLARRIIAEFTKAGLNDRAITALGYLTEAIANRKVPPRLVTQVQEYIVSLRRAPERDFAYVEV
jgi:tetratricopeptide (TPR) repeat protein